MASTAAAQNQGVLQDLLHVLSQPLTTLYCALEHSLEADNAAQTDDVALALEQTDRVIEAVRLMREYLEAEEGCFLAEPFPLGLAIENVLEELSVLAEARGLLLFASGTSRAAIPVRNAWVQRALLYLFVLLLESGPSGRAIVVLLEDGATGSAR
jgi:signal transduction histidine kinase